MTSTISTLGLDVLERFYTNQFTDVTQNASEFEQVMNLFPNKVDGAGDVINHGFRVVGNSSGATYSENEPMQAASQTTVVQGIFQYVNYRSVAAITAQAEQAARGGPREGFYIKGETDAAFADLKQTIVETLLADASTGIVGLVDSSSTIGGLSRTQYPKLASIETTASSAALTLAQMSDTCDALAKVGAKTSVIVCSIDTLTGYLSLVPTAPTSSGAANTIALEGGRQVDLGYNRSFAAYNTIPIITLKNFSNTDMLFLDLNGFQLVERRPFEIKVWEDIQSDRRVVAFHWSAGLVCTRPDLQGKISLITNS